uniref:Carbamoyl phosphate synthase small chain n=1 Tax=Apophlaea sinclairii TaxID=212746 RepID=A0A1C9CBN9_9FLOR|nr:carbamoyl-phosphate synthase arginine-specific small subunit [Apophlaea sinclairii]AOM65796.1 carbamoyl-phosphate synthase arginine-specific small subunit [Apophlaea sinclairii]
MTKINPAVLVLEDGSVYRGWSYSKLSIIIGEIVFNTGMTGYQEILTDPSYCNQIITFTYPEIGNTGTNFIDKESTYPLIKGIIIKNLCKFPSNWRKKQSLIKYLQLFNIMCIYGLDTRSLTKHLRNYGSMNGIISNKGTKVCLLLKQLKAFTTKTTDLVAQVTTNNMYSVRKRCCSQWHLPSFSYNKQNKVFRVVVIDFGIKTNIIRRLQAFKCEIIVVSAKTSAKIIASYKPNGILLSNGPGDPSIIVYAIKTIKNLLKFTLPIFGICMGHQLLSIALGLKTYKLKFGHRGLNHPTGWLDKVYITSQNHGFAVNNKPSINNSNIEITHINFNDGTVAGLTHKVLPLFSVQYHPEASPGPHDSDYLFAYFISMMYHYDFKALS